MPDRGGQGRAIDSPPVAARSLPEPLREIGRSVAAIPALIMVAVLVALGAASGGYYETAYLPAALFTLALLAVALLAISTRAQVPRTVSAAVGLFGAYAAWSYLSILWAADQGAAWEGANRALFYALVFALFALWPIRAWPATAIVGAFGLGIAALGVVTLLRASGAADLSEMFVYGRFVEPVGYTNGNVALWFSGVLPCVFLAARREVWPPVRGLALGGAGVLLGLAVLGQSRGWLAALPVVLIVFIAIAPGRARNGVALLGLALATVAFLDPVLAVFGGFGDGRDLEPLMKDAAEAILLVSAVLAVLGAAIGFADRGIRLEPGTARRARAVTAGALAVTTAAAVVVLLVTVGDPVASASDAWEDFKAGSEEADQPVGESRFTSAAGQNRYDYWAVALSQFGDDPLTGAGTGSFQSAYLREGETPQRPQFPHSLGIRLLSETGIVGALLLVAGMVLALVAGARAVRRRSELGAAAAATAIATFVYWAVHGSVDWFYELPALGAAAFAMLGLAASLTPRLRILAPRRPASNALVGGPARTAGLVVAVVAMGAALAVPWLAQLQVDAAAEEWEEDPAAAFDRLDRAARLDPLSIEPHTTAAAIALRLDDPEMAREEFAAVLERDPEDAYATLQLGALASQSGEREEALDLLRRANELSPQDTLVDDALARVREGDRLDPRVVYENALARRSSLTAAP